jgi:hypothetical protein
VPLRWISAVRNGPCGQVLPGAGQDFLDVLCARNYVSDIRKTCQLASGQDPFQEGWSQARGPSSDAKDITLYKDHGERPFRINGRLQFNSKG